jgi:hypothetical protein
MSMVEHALNENFIYAEHKVLLIIDDEPLNLLEKITRFQQPEGLKRWISRE